MLCCELVLKGSPRLVNVMLPGDMVCVASISAFKSFAILDSGGNCCLCKSNACLIRSSFCDDSDMLC